MLLSEGSIDSQYILKVITRHIAVGDKICGILLSHPATSEAQLAEDDAAQNLRPKIPTVITTDNSKYYKLLDPYIQFPGNSRMTLPLFIDDKRLGSLSLCVFGEGKYKAGHLDLLATDVALPTHDEFSDCGRNRRGWSLS